MIDPAAARRAAEAIPSIPCNAEGPVFREPWEAQAFAMALALHERGVFSWPEWAATLGEEIKRAQAAGDPDTGETYYHHWLNTLERLVAAKGVSNAGEEVVGTTGNLTVNNFGLDMGAGLANSLYGIKVLSTTGNIAINNNYSQIGNGAGLGVNTAGIDAQSTGGNININNQFSSIFVDNSAGTQYGIHAVTGGSWCQVIPLNRSTPNSPTTRTEPDGCRWTIVAPNAPASTTRSRSEPAGRSNMMPSF